MNRPADGSSTCCAAASAPWPSSSARWSSASPASRGTCACCAKPASSTFYRPAPRTAARRGRRVAGAVPGNTGAAARAV